MISASDVKELKIGLEILDSFEDFECTPHAIKFPFCDFLVNVRKFTENCEFKNIY